MVRRTGTTQLIAQDDITVLKQRDDTINCFAQHFDQLLNVPKTVNKTASEELPDSCADANLENAAGSTVLNAAIAFTLGKAAQIDY